MNIIIVLNMMTRNINRIFAFERGVASLLDDNIKKLLKQLEIGEGD